MLSRSSRQAHKALTSAPSRGYEPQRLYFNDKGNRNSISGIKATVFGGTSPLGLTVGASLTERGSVCVYPHRNPGDLYDSKFRELKVTADLGHK